MSLVPAILGLIAQTSGNQTVQDIGAIFAGAAPTVYVHGRGKIKATKIAKSQLGQGEPI